MLNRQELEEQGWSQASVTGGQHLARTVEMYHETGFETYMEEIDPAECGGCVQCYREGGETAYRVYTRPKDRLLNG